MHLPGIQLSSVAFQALQWPSPMSRYIYNVIDTSDFQVAKVMGENDWAAAVATAIAARASLPANVAKQVSETFSNVTELR